MSWIKKNWKILAVIAGVLAIVGGIILYNVMSGNQGSEKEETEVVEGVITDLSGQYISSNNPKKAEIHFTADGTKEAQGVFKDFKAVLDIDGSLESAKITVTIDPTSVFTDNDLRDDHLKGEDFFNTPSYAEIVFTSDKIVKDGENFKAIGKLNFLGKDWDFEFPFTYRGKGEIDGKELGSFEGSFTFDHNKHGMKKSGDADNASVKFYVDMIKGGDAEAANDDDAMDDDDLSFDDEEEEEVVMPTREYDDLLDKVEEEASK